MSSSQNESALEKFIEKIDFAKLEGKPEDFYKAGIAFVENGQFDDGIVEFVKVIKTTPNQDNHFIECQKELESLGFSKNDIQTVIRTPIPKISHLKINEENSSIANDVNRVKQKSTEEEMYRVISRISLFVLFIAGLGSLCLGLVGLGTGDEGGRQSAMPFVVIYPIIFLLPLLLSKGLHKLGETRYALFIDILSIILVIFLVATNFK